MASLTQWTWVWASYKSWWCHPTILSSVISFSSYLQSFPASGSFKMSQLLASGGQSTGVSALPSVLPVNIQDWFPLVLTGLISFSPRDSQESSPTPQFKSMNSLVLSFIYGPTLTSIHDYWKKYSFYRWTFIGKVMFLLFNKLSRLVIAFLPRSNCLLILWLQNFIFCRLIAFWSHHFQILISSLNL